ncbi:hypothetical protein [Kribbella sp. NPDC003557]|uniref:hypothetical protein n=1 Tax=Kribbella sp. NPDC003557 TaxID=3154449 RepID=UPI0033A79C54
MPDGEAGRKHITEALGGRAVAPLSDDDRVERERVRDLVQAVAGCYHTLVAQQAGANAELAAKLDFHDAEFRRRDTMSAAERAEVLRSYPALLAELRAEIDG